MSTRITIDPITRIEGHLRIDCEIDNNKVTKAWASGQMWRGIELILIGKDPRDAWTICQRICGVCTTVHAIVSVRAVENALKLEIPLNAQLIRNLIIGSHAIHDHITHFYHLSALDWVDIVSALSADVQATAKLAEGLSSWKLNSQHELAQVQQRLKKFVETGQLGIFTNGYWGHPAMKLSPEVNLLAAAHYLQALEMQRKINEVVTILGSKTPHIQNLAVGGVSNPINLDSQSALNMERLFHIKTIIDQVGDFINNVYLVDIAAIAAHYAEWTQYGAGITNYLTVPEMPLDGKGSQFSFPGGFIENGDLSSFKPITNYQDTYFEQAVAESVKHSWYQGGKGALHPYEGETIAQYTDFEDDGKYSWIKSPTFYGKRAQVGPLANVLCMYAAGHEPTKRYVGKVVDTVSNLLGSPLPLTALHSTLGRHAARAIRCAVLHEELSNQWNRLITNLNTGDFTTYNRPTFPNEEIRGFGYHEAPRGTLSHWAVIEKGKIKNYQCVVPTTWNAGPRDENDAIGPYEAALMDNPVINPELPLEVLRTVHSFDPCLACAIHLTDVENNNAVSVKTNRLG